MGPKERELTKQLIIKINELYTKYKTIYPAGKSVWTKGVEACDDIQELYHKCATNNSYVIEQLKLELLAIKKKLSGGQTAIIDITMKGWFGRVSMVKQPQHHDFSAFTADIESLITTPEFNQGLIEARDTDSQATTSSTTDVGSLVNSQLENLKKELETKLKQELEEKSRQLDEKAKQREVQLVREAAEKLDVLTEDNKILAYSEVGHQRANALGDNVSTATGLSSAPTGVELPDEQKDFNLEKRFYAALPRLGINQDQPELHSAFVFYREAFTLINRIGSSSAYFANKAEKDMPFERRPLQYQLLYTSVCALFTIKDIAQLKAELTKIITESRLEDKHKLKLKVLCREMPENGVNPLVSEKVSKAFLMAIYAREANNYQKEVEANKSRVGIAGYYVVNEIHKAVKKTLGITDEKPVKVAKSKGFFDEANRSGTSSASSAGSAVVQQLQDSAPTLN